MSGVTERLEDARGVDVAERRLRRQHLIGPRLESPTSALSWLCGVQSQDYGPAKWSLGLRAEGTSDADLDVRYDAAELLRTHVLRATWHFVSPEDIRWMLELTGPRVHASSAYYYRQLGLDRPLRERTTRLLADVLKGGNHLTRKQIASLLQREGISASGLRMGYILMHAELEGVVCSGVRSGKQHTYALLDERAPMARSLPRAEALAELTLRYFTSRGPATVGDLAVWSSLTRSDVSAGIEMVGDRLESETIGNFTFWSPPEPGRHDRQGAREVQAHLLQSYDEYVMGYGESRVALDAAGVGTQGRRTDVPPFNHVLIVDGQLAGHWKRTIQRSSLLVEVQLYDGLDAESLEAVQAAADLHAEFLGLSGATVQIGMR